MTLAAEGGQLQLNAFEPVIAAVHLRVADDVRQRRATRCASTASKGSRRTRRSASTTSSTSIGTVTALNPVIGYDKATELAAEALKTGEGILELVREKHILTDAQIDEILSPAALTGQGARLTANRQSGSMNYFVTSLREHPELAIFLTLALGFVIGRFSIRSFKLGNVVGTLLAGLLIGQLGIEVPAIVKTVFFDLFLFATGYKVGPQFIRGLGKSALPQVALTIVRLHHLPRLGVSRGEDLRLRRRHGGGDDGGRIHRFGDHRHGERRDQRGLAFRRTRRSDCSNNVPMAYAVTYILGTTGVVWFLTALAPKLLGADIAAESRKMEEESGGGSEQEGGPVPAYREWDFRAYQLNGDWAGRSVGDLEGSFAPDRVFVERVRHEGQVMVAEPASMLASGDAVAIAARRRVVSRGLSLGSEIEDKELLDFPVASADVVITNKAIVNRRSPSSRRSSAEAWHCVASCAVARRSRSTTRRRVNRGDLLRIAGPQEDVERASKALGTCRRTRRRRISSSSGLGITLGGLVGLLSVTLGGVPITLTASGGALIMGLVFGWLRSVYPTFGGIPEPALWLFDTLGLAVFIAVVGLAAGPSFIDGLRRTGLTLPLVGGSAGHHPPSHRDPLRQVRAEDESRASPRCLRRSGHQHSRAARGPGPGAEQDPRPRATPFPTPSPPSSWPRGVPSSSCCSSRSLLMSSRFAVPLTLVMLATAGLPGRRHQRRPPPSR